MSDTGYTLPTVAATSGAEILTWSDKDNILVGTDVGFASVAAVDVVDGVNTNLLIAKTFGLDIPAGNYVTGVAVLVRFDQDTTDGNFQDVLVSLFLPSVGESGSKALNANLPTSFTSVVYGADWDLWSRSTIKVSDVEHADFAVRVRCQTDGANTVSTAKVAYVQVKVFYLPIPAATVPPGIDEFTGLRVSSQALLLDS